MNPIFKHPLLDTPAKVLIIGLTISIIIIILAVPFIQTTEIVCTNGKSFWYNCYHILEETWTTTNNLNFLNWLIAFDNLSFRFIYLVVFSLLIAIISMAYYFIALDFIKTKNN